MEEESKEMDLKSIEQLKEENRFLREELRQIKMKQEKRVGVSEVDGELLGQVFKALPDMVAVFDYEGHVLKVVANNHSGIPTEELLGMHLSSVLDEESTSFLMESLQRAKATGRLSIGSHSLTLNDTTYRYEDRIMPLTEKTALCIFHDITLIEQRNREIDELNSLLCTIMDSLPVHLFVKEIHNGMKYLFWNKHFAESLGIPAEQVIGRTDVEFFPRREDGEKFMRDDQLLIENPEGKIEFIEEYVNVAGEKRIVNTRKVITPLLSGGKQLLIGTSMDITNLKKAERELEEARSQAVKNDASKSVFLSNMGHEIRTPVNAIVGFANLLAEAEDEEERGQYISIIESNSNLLLKLIDDILDISKIEAGALEFVEAEVNLGRICSDLFVVHHPNAKEGVTLIYDESDENLVFRGDPNRIMQVLINFLTNACKFTRKGEIHYGFREEGGSIYVYVSDTGAGIPESKLPTLFDRFVRLDSETAGTGLGLAICKMIIEHMKGQIGVSSKVGEGSTFYFRVPRS